MPHGDQETPALERWSSFQDRLSRRGERRLVLVEGNRAEALAWLADALPLLPRQPGVWIGQAQHCPADYLTALEPARAQEWLGRELSVVAWDGWQGNPPDAIAALSGTLRAGGLFFWLMPPLAQWPDFNDPDYARTGLESGSGHPFAARMARILADDPAVLRVDAGRASEFRLPELAEPESPFAVQTTEDQQALVKRLIECGLGRRRKPLVVTADRGRGKSAALGMAAARLVLQGRQRVLVCAPNPGNVATLLHHARETLADELLEASDHGLTTHAGAQIRFLPTRQLLAEKPEAEVVMVDEAAAIPAPLLKQVLLGWPRVVFSSTVHGYEGSGRGFAIRFRQVLDRETPRWQSVTLKAPVRWSAQDPLEPLIARLFLLAADTGPAQSAADSASAVVIERWSPGSVEETELAVAFGLLVNAHYRTTPADLRQWMDAPDTVSWRASQAGKTVGVLWATVEGGLSADLAEQVTLGKRRPRGHLLAQSLASHSGFPEAASQKCLRVVRIAVSEQVRRQGVGQRLVQAAAQHVGVAGLDSLGTSFGGSADLLTFWQSCGMRLVRVGLTQEASSGEYPVQMLRASSAAGQSLQARLRQRLAEHWLTLVPLAWQQLEPELLAALTGDLPATPQCSADDTRDLSSFAHGHRGFVLTLPVLRKLSLEPGVMALLAGPPDLSLWVAAVLRQRPWAELQRDRLCTGQRDGENRLRALVRLVLEQRPEL
ncbi:tRNA(Met) cytidine acetyltransferase [Marinobacter salinisoli]|uniref:tRNA(Met) cytidine acetyltransferase TmcA n=1 Tax=Marinobacter salinisoli TaxID=2769486 RepID=A0ABX7MSN7_9GAMM|nr:GNAT family N-acetyltransferase [Marinobacter salinisoli]QSP95323.1 tRNA(Met) cytidine acetyltransferase [Marinobacter salinisoli]